MAEHPQRTHALGAIVRRPARLIAIMLAVFALATTAAPTAAQSVDDDQLQTAFLQSYFISVDNFAGPVMMGGMGVPLVPAMVSPDDFMVMMGQMAEMANFDMSTMPANPGMIAAIYASGEPALVPDVTPDPMDFGTMRWDPAGFDTSITTRDQAVVIMKFIEWAKYFHKGFNGESALFTPDMEAFLSLAFTAEAMMVSNFTGMNLMGESGYITSINMDDGARTVEDATVQPFDQAAMLWALSDLMLTLNDMESYPNLGALAQTVASPEMMQGMMDMWGQTFELVKANPTTDPKDAGLAIAALTWYAAAKGDMAPLDEIVAAVDGIAAGLGSSADSAFEKASAIRGLTEAWRLTGNDAYLTTALTLWDELDALWDDDAKTYASASGATRYTYTPWDAGLIIGALSELINATGDAVGSDVKDLVKARYVDFLNGTVIGSGFTHLPVPTPGRSGLYVAEISYDTATSDWTVVDSRYTTAGSQYAANEMIWLEGTLQGRLTGYPALPSLTAPQPVAATPSVGDATIPGYLLAGAAVLGLLIMGSGATVIIRRRA